MEKGIVGVVGAGVMGAGVAERFARYGYHILLTDISQRPLEIALGQINRSIRIHNMVSKDRVDSNEVLGRIKTGVDLHILGDADYLVENVPEKIHIKRDVYHTLNGICKDSCLFMTNTSCIPITKIAAYTTRPDRVIGTHFMNPVPKKSFVEVIRGVHTSEETVDVVRRFLETADIHCTIVNDSAGFVSNRLSHIFMNEAANLVLEGVGTPEQVDLVFTEGFQHAMGPLHTADLIGIDTVVDSLQVLFECYGDPKYRSSPLLQKMRDAGWLGCKSGKGFFEY